MKTKIGTILDEEIVQTLKERSTKEKRSISEIIQDALVNYFRGGKRKRELRVQAVERFCSNPFKLSPEDWKEIMELDVYDQ